MKKLIILAVLAVSQLCCAQYVEVTPEGLTGTAEFKTAKNMYAETLEYITRNYSADAIEGAIDGKYLRIACYTEAGVQAKGGIFREPFDAYYSTVFEFADNSVKIYYINVRFAQTNRTAVTYAITYQGGETFAIYDKKGELKGKDTKLSIDMLFNNNISKFKRALYGRS